MPIWARFSKTSSRRVTATHGITISGNRLRGYSTCPYTDHLSTAFPYQMSTNIYNGRPAFITESDLYPPPDNHGNPITDKDGQATATANSIRDFVYYEATASGGYGASRIAVWLLNDDCNNSNDGECQKHMWAQAYNSNPGTNYFRAWFGQWWFGPEPHVN